MMKEYVQKFKAKVFLSSLYILCRAASWAYEVTLLLTQKSLLHRFFVCRFQSLPKPNKQPLHLATSIINDTL